MILMTLSGYLGTGVNTELFFLFSVTKFEALIDFIHKEMMWKWAVWILIQGHAAEAMYHHFVAKAHTLKKMTRG